MGIWINQRGSTFLGCLSVDWGERQDHTNHSTTSIPVFIPKKFPSPQAPYPRNFCKLHHKTKLTAEVLRARARSKYYSETRYACQHRCWGNLLASLAAEPVSPSLQPRSTPHVCAGHVAQPTPDHCLSPMCLAVWPVQLQWHS